MFSGFKLKYVLPLLIFLFSCHADKGKNKDAKFVQAYGEILFFTEKFKGDTLRIKEKVDSVLNVSGITMKQMDSIASAYSRDPEKWAEFFENVKKYLEEKRLDVQGKKH